MKNRPALDPVNALRVSKLRIGTLRAQGVPAILLGAASIVLASGAVVLAAGAMRALQAGVPTLPETIRELRQLFESNRRSQPLMP
jgi:hypothetical protein